MSFRIKFVGAVGTVTGSCHLVHHLKSDSYYLVDCGMHQGEYGWKSLNLARAESDFGGVAPSQIKAVFLTHAHMDHCGLIPRLYRLGFTGRVICTRFTANCALESLRDTVRNVQGFDHELFTLEDVNRITFECPDDNPEFTLGRIHPVYGDTDMVYCFNRTGHLAGCVAISLTSFHGNREGCTITFGADLGPQAERDDPGASLLKPYQYPSHFTNYLVLESTYGGKPARPSLGYDGRIAVLSNVLEHALSPGRGPNPTVIMPAFALGRTQDLVVDLTYLITRTDFVSRIGGVAPTVVVDSKLARFYSNQFALEFRNHRVDSRTGARKMRLLNDEHRLFADLSPEDREALVDLLFAGEGAREIDIRSNKGDSFELIYDRVTREEGPVIYISSSGMCTSGPVMGRLRRNLGRTDSTVVFTGYIQDNIDARLLKNHAARGDSPEEVARQFSAETSLAGHLLQDFEMLPSEVKATLVDLSSIYSGHADDARLVDYALFINNVRLSEDAFKPLTVFLVHGENKSRGMVRRALEKAAQEGIEGCRTRRLQKVVLPGPSSGWYNLERNEWEPVEQRHPSWSECLRLLSEAEEIQSKLGLLFTSLQATDPTQGAARDSILGRMESVLSDAEVWRRRLKEMLARKIGPEEGSAGATYAAEGMSLDLTARPELQAAAGLLGLTGCLTRLLLIRAYRLQMKRVHPDFHPHADDAQRAELVQSAQEINAAYEALSAALESAN